MKNRITRLTSLFIGLIILGLMFSSPGDTKIDEDSIVLMWLFDEGAGDVVKDSSGHGNDGTITGAEWADGKFNRGLESEANNNVVSSTAEGVGPTFFSETLWVNFNDFNTENQLGFIRCSGTANARYFYFSSWSADGAPHNRIHLGTLNLDGSWGRGISAPKMFDKGKWYHVAGVINNEEGSIRAYVDGELKHEQKFAVGDTPGTPTEIWAGSAPEAGRSLIGVIDEVGFFNVALTEDDIKKIMNDGLSKATGIEAVDPLSKLTTTWGGIKNAE